MLLGQGEEFGEIGFPSFGEDFCDSDPFWEQVTPFLTTLVGVVDEPPKQPLTITGLVLASDEAANLEVVHPQSPTDSTVGS